MIPNYRSSFWKTTLLALVVAALSLILSTTLVSAGETLASRLVWILLSLPFFLLSALAALAALGGMIGLHRDALERRGKPYFSHKPRERSPGWLSKLRRRTLNLRLGSQPKPRFWPGEWARVKPFSEIAATLDEKGCLDGLPFMPEMLRLCGSHHRVFRRAEKFRDYFSPGAGLRRLRDAVMLNDLRCSGEAHGGCQAGCQFIWKEAWLEPVNEPAVGGTLSSTPCGSQLYEFARPKEGCYACQMTELPRATSPMRFFHDPRHYLRDFWCGNVRFNPFVKAVALALFNVVQGKTGRPTAPYRGAGGLQIDVSPSLNLRPGDIVRVKSKQEIEKTLKNSWNRGLWFDVEMHRFCGGEFRVAQRVETIVGEASGRMLTMKHPCIVLEGVSATGEYLGLYPQNELIYWREVWLERVSKEPETAAAEINNAAR
jgi:hypothetical protein